MKRLLMTFAIAILLSTVLLVPVTVLASWPGQVLLWRGTTPVTQTIQYQAVDVVGANYAYLFYDTGLASATGTAAITITRQWRGITFQTITTTAEISTSQSATGVITVASASPYYPSAQVSVQITAGTMTPTIALIGQ